ncbi:MAG: NADP-dependent oxidoreductase [Deltaproteobacteria bacterium]|nr:NADP-dependent oxidoreductase [Deltaproteobacteria bacterium]
MSSRVNTQIVLRAHPQGPPREGDFGCVQTAVPRPADGQFLIRNLYLSLDAGFRQWMNEGAGDGYLPAMELNQPVMGLVLGEVVESRQPDYAAGDLVMGRTRWESYSLADGTDYMTKLAADPDVPISHYLGALGPTGLTAYFGMRDIGRPKPGETVLVSTAAGAVGSVAAQIARIRGSRVIGLTSSDDKCRWLVEELGLDGAINYRAGEGLETGLSRLCPDGIDVYFDSVGGATLDTALAHLRIGARVVMCGALAGYNDTKPLPGPFNMFKVITQRALLQGFMVTDYVAEYPAAIDELAGWLKEGRLRGAEEVVEGIEQTGPAFCRMFAGGNRGKLVVHVGERSRG